MTRPSNCEVCDTPLHYYTSYPILVEGLNTIFWTCGSADCIGCILVAIKRRLSAIHSCQSN